MMQDKPLAFCVRLATISWIALCCVAARSVWGQEAAPEATEPPPADTGNVVQEITQETLPPAEAMKSGLLRWLGEELAAPLRKVAEGQEAQAEVLAEEVVAMREEVTALRQEMSDLRETLDLLVREILSDLRADNDELRALLGQQAAAGTDPERLAEMSDEALAQTVRERLGPPDSSAAPLAFEILEEWGRTPEDVAQLGGKASTLKGIIGLVEAGASQGALEKLGRDLRAQYDNYDNINIEVFDEQSAAEGFQASPVTNPAHRVLTVSRHRASGRDSIVVYPNGLAREVQ